MQRRLLRRVAPIALGVGLLGAVSTHVPARAATLDSGHWATDGSAVSTGQPAPDVPGATGSFQLGNLSGSSGVSPAENSQGQITVYVYSGTKFYACDNSGNNCVPSTQAKVVQVGGETVFAEGRYYDSGGQESLVAEYVFSPPPAPTPPPATPTADPQPSSVQDYDLSDLYGVQGLVVGTGEDLLGKFSVGAFFGSDPYGCGSSGDCRTEQIAAAHGGQISIDPQPGSGTNLWIGDSSGCNFVKASSLLSVLQPGTTNGVLVNGHYVWAGTDWAFFASNIFEPPPAAPGSCPAASVGPLPISVQFVESSQGTFNAATNEYENTQWSGQTDPNDSSFGNGGSATMSLTFQQSGSVWDFWGTYMLTNSSGSTTLGGSINGTSPAPSPGAVLSSMDAQATVGTATGQFANWQGSGTYHGSASYLVGSTPEPPDQSSGQFIFDIQPSS